VMADQAGLVLALQGYLGWEALDRRISPPQ